MFEHKTGIFNPTPISKLLVTLFLSINVTRTIPEFFSLLIVVFFCILFALQGKLKTAINTMIFYLVVSFFVLFMDYDIPKFIKDYILLFALVIKMFFLPILAGKFLIETSDVSSMIVSMEKMRFPKVIVIPIAVVFRYFPAFREDKNNIKMAMKMRGITFWNPIKYLEYVSVPLLISAVGIADDISKSAETKCISDPIQKTRYFEVKFGVVDVIFMVIVVAIYVTGRLYA